MMPQTEVPTPVVVQNTPNPGFKSTELYTTLATAITIGAGLVPPQYAPIVAAISGVYVAARTLLKAVHAMGYAKKLPDLPQIGE